MKERDIENQILTWLNYQPDTFAFKVNTTGFFDTKRKVFRKNRSKFIVRGTSDILGTRKGRLLAIECKTPQGLKKFLNHPTEHELNQKAFLEKVIACGGIGICVDSLDSVISFFGKIA